MFQRLVIVLTIIGLAHNELLNLTCAEIKKFVDGHNKRRLLILQGKIKGQPRAVKMNSVVWDDSIAAKAGHWASVRPSVHNPDKTIATFGFLTGENMYAAILPGTNATLDPEIPLSQWFKEHETYTFGNGLLNPYQTWDSDQYTQMVWSDTTYIGCGISRFPFQKMTKFIVVCNYGPTGNLVGVLPYPLKEIGVKNIIWSNELSCGGRADCSKPYGKKCAKKLLRLSFGLRIYHTN